MKHIIAALLFAATASAQSIFLQSEQRVTPPRIGMPSTWQRSPGIATGDTNHLIVWTDDRSNRDTHTLGAVYATRVDLSGHVLDAPNLMLPLTGDHLFPFWNGRQYVVIADSGYVRISASGELIDQGPLAISGAMVARVVHGGDRVLVYVQKGGGYHASLYDSSMHVIHDEFVVNPLLMASNGNGFAGIYANELWIFDRDMNLTGKKPWPSNSLPARWIVSDGANYLVGGQYSNWKAGQNQLFTAALDPDGTMRNGAPFYGDVPVDGFTQPQLYWDGAHYQYVYGSYTTGLNVWSYTLDRDGIPIGLSTPEKLTGASNFIVSGRDGSHLLLREASSYDVSFHDTWNAIVYADPLSFATTATQPFDYARAALPHETPVAANAGDISLVVWRAADTTVADSFALYAARADHSGHWLDAPMRLTDMTCDAVYPTVTTNGRDFLVAWQQPASVRVMRIAHDGRLLDPQPVILSAPVPTPLFCITSTPSVAWNGANYFVIWIGDRDVLYGERMQANGNLLDPVPLTITSGGPIANPLIASNGSEYYVTWTDRRISLVRGIRLSGAGVPVAPDLLINVPRVNALFWSGRNYVALSSATDGVRAVRITSDGVSPDATYGFPVVPMQFPIDGSAPHVECDARGCFTYSVTENVLIGTRIDDSGPSVSFTSSVLMHLGDVRRNPLVFGNDFGAIAYLRLRTEPEYGGTWQLLLGTTGLARGRAVR